MLRFNFRGVVAAKERLRAGPVRKRTSSPQSNTWRALPGLPLWAAGFSFGAWIALETGAAADGVTVIIGIAPPVTREGYDFSNTRRSTKPKFFVQGEADDICPLEDMWKFYSELPEPKELVVIDAASGAQVLFQQSHDDWGGPAFSVDGNHLVSAVRTPIGKAPNGALRYTRPDEMAAVAIKEALRRVSGLDASEVDDVILGCAMPEAEQGLNVARIASLRAGVPISASAVTVNRFCSSGLQAIAYGAERIMVGGASVVIAGGTESMSMVPMGGNKIAPNPALVDSYPDVYLTTGLVAENHVRDYGISRGRAPSLRSHQRAVAAIDAGASPTKRSPSGT